MPNAILLPAGGGSGGQYIEPFDRYPHRGRVPLGRPRGANCRHEYGLQLQQITGQTACAYCGLDLTDTYHHWLLMSIDHVVPRGEAQRLGIHPEITEDFINLVLSCSGCNGFNNRYPVPAALAEPLPTWELERFVTLRDRVFSERLAQVRLIL